MRTRRSASLPAALPQALAGMRALGMVGLNVTVPHKQAVMAHLDEISAEAQSIGAVNTIVNRDGRLVGYNTDAFGIVQSLKADGGLDPLPPKVALLGAGGAARAVLYALLAREEVEEVLLLNRTVEKAIALAGDLDSAGKVRVGSLAETDPIGDAGLLINATALGMHPREDISPLADPSCLHEHMLVADIVYNPLETMLIAAGCRRWCIRDQRLGYARLAGRSLVRDMDGCRAAGRGNDGGRTGAFS